MISRIKNKKVLWITITLILIGSGILIKNRFFSTNSNPRKEEQIIVTAQKGTLQSTVSASGQIETANYLSVTTSVNGIVKQVFVKEGAKVIKGQKIMEITLNSEGEESLAQAWGQYLSAKTSLEKAKNDYLKLESDLTNAEESFQNEKEHNSYQTHDERVAFSLAENTYNSAKNLYDLQADVVKQAEINVNKTWLTYQAQSPTIVAPGSGTIANIVVVEGMDITNSLSERTSSTVASIKNDGEPIASLNISEVDINKIKVGQKVKLTLNSIENKTFSGIVAGIDKIGTVSSGVTNYPVIIKFDEASDQVLPNMGVDAEIILEEKSNAIYVPTAALFSNRGSVSVRVQENGQISTREITTGIKTADYTEIVSGINEGERVVVNALPTSGFNNNESGNSRFMMGPGTFPRR